MKTAAESVNTALKALLKRTDDDTLKAVELLLPVNDHLPDSAWPMFINPDSPEGVAVIAALRDDAKNA